MQMILLMMSAKSTSYVWIYVVLGVMVAATLALLRSKMPSKKEKNGHESEQTKLLMELNIQIDKYNSTTDLFSMKYEEIAKSAKIKKDFESYESVVKIGDDFTEIRNEAYEKVEQTKACLRENDMQVSRELIIDTNNLIADMQALIGHLEEIHPQERVEQYKQQSEEMQMTGTISFSKDFFAGCNTLNEVEGRYRALAKAFHPDTGHGDDECFQKLNEEYESIKHKLAV